jgi:hypothetical protein
LTIQIYTMQCVFQFLTVQQIWLDFIVGNINRRRYCVLENVKRTRSLLSMSRFAIYMKNVSK